MIHRCRVSCMVWWSAAPTPMRCWAPSIPVPPPRYRVYDDFVILYNEKFAKPGKMVMDELLAQGLLTKTQFDEEIEWTWFYLWHHEGRRARHGASMMAPDYAHWHGMSVTSFQSRLTVPSSR